MENILIGFFAISTLLGGLVTDSWEVTKDLSAQSAEASYMPLIAPELPQVATSTPETPYCSCMAYARSKMPSLPRGDAKDIETDSIFPVLHSVMKLSYRKADEKTPMLYHAAFVEKITSEGKALISSDCKHGKHEIIYEWIDLNNEKIQGYKRPEESG